jgi:hypothetical protein
MHKVAAALVKAGKPPAPMTLLCHLNKSAKQELQQYIQDNPDLFCPPENQSKGTKRKRKQQNKRSSASEKVCISQSVLC